MVTLYTCKGTDEAGFAGEDQIKKAKMSFVSGHASFSCQSATFVVLYLQSKSSYMAKVLKDYDQRVFRYLEITSQRHDTTSPGHFQMKTDAESGV